VIRYRYRVTAHVTLIHSPLRVVHTLLLYTALYDCPRYSCALFTRLQPSPTTPLVGGLVQVCIGSTLPRCGLITTHGYVWILYHVLIYLCGYTCHSCHCVPFYGLFTHLYGVVGYRLLPGCCCYSYNCLSSPRLHYTVHLWFVCVYYYVALLVGMIRIYNTRFARCCPVTLGPACGSPRLYIFTTLLPHLPARYTRVLYTTFTFTVATHTAHGVRFPAHTPHRTFTFFGWFCPRFAVYLPHLRRAWVLVGYHHTFACATHTRSTHVRVAVCTLLPVGFYYTVMDFTLFTHTDTATHTVYHLVTVIYPHTVYMPPTLLLVLVVGVVELPIPTPTCWFADGSVPLYAVYCPRLDMILHAPRSPPVCWLHIRTHVNVVHIYASLRVYIGWMYYTIHVTTHTLRWFIMPILRSTCCNAHTRHTTPPHATRYCRLRFGLHAPATRPVALPAVLCPHPYAHHSSVVLAGWDGSVYGCTRGYHRLVTHYYLAGLFWLQVGSSMDSHTRGCSVLLVTVACYFVGLVYTHFLHTFTPFGFYTYTHAVHGSVRSPRTRACYTTHVRPIQRSSAFCYVRLHYHVPVRVAVTPRVVAGWFAWLLLPHICCRCHVLHCLATLHTFYLQHFRSLGSAPARSLPHAGWFWFCSYCYGCTFTRWILPRIVLADFAGLHVLDIRV